MALLRSIHHDQLPPLLACHPSRHQQTDRGVKQIHRLAEALAHCGRQATLIQEQADFHPGWFESQVDTISLASWRQRSDLDPRRDVVVLPETFLPSLPSYGPGLPKLMFNQNGSYSFGFREGDGFPETAEAVLNLYSHSDLAHVLCVSQHDQQLLERGFSLGSHKVSRLILRSKPIYFSLVAAKKGACSPTCPQEQPRCGDRRSFAASTTLV